MHEVLQRGSLSYPSLSGMRRRGIAPEAVPPRQQVVDEEPPKVIWAENTDGYPQSR